MSVSVDSPKRRSGDSKRISPNRKSLDAELYGLGRTIRHLQPPGGIENGVGDALKTTPPQEVVATTPGKRVKDYFKSSVFDFSELPARPVAPTREDTHRKLFPGSPPENARPFHNRMKSVVFDSDPPKGPPPEQIKRNPVTGEGCKALDESRGLKERNVRNPITFEGVTERTVPSRCTQPPGGKTTFVLEYIE